MEGSFGASEEQDGIDEVRVYREHDKTGVAFEVFPVTAVCAGLRIDSSMCFTSIVNMVLCVFLRVLAFVGSSCMPMYRRRSTSKAFHFRFRVTHVSIDCRRYGLGWKTYYGLRSSASVEPCARQGESPYG